MANNYAARTASPSDGDEIRWYFSNVPMADNVVAASFTRTEILELDDYSQFILADSNALEALFLQRDEELFHTWWNEHASARVVFGSQQQQLKEKEEKSTAVLVSVREEKFEVDLVSRCCFPKFPLHWKKRENRRVVRGHWFALKRNKWHPIREDISLQLEFAYRTQVWHRTTKQPWGLFAARVDLTCSTLGLFALFKGDNDSWEACLCTDHSGGTVGFKLRRGYVESVSLIRIGTSPLSCIFGDPFFDDMEICLLRVGAVPATIDQEDTNGCFAIACVGTLFSLAYLSGYDRPTLLSAQELVDWLWHYHVPNYKPGAPVPDGGFPNSLPAAFCYVQHFGLYPESMYPRAGVFRRTPYKSNLENPEKKTYILGYREVDQDEAISILRTNQSLVAGIVASPSFYEWEYKVGDEIFEGATSEEIKTLKDQMDHKESSGERADPPFHAILLVGYSERSGQGHFLVQNSGGPFWAHGGFLKVSCTACFDMHYPIGMYRKEGVVLTELGETELTFEKTDDDFLDGLADLFQVEEDEATDMEIEY